MTRGAAGTGNIHSNLDTA